MISPSSPSLPAPPDYRLTVSPARLAAWLDDSRALTLRLVDSLRDEQWTGPYLPTVNPPLWEVGHVAWFLERWCLRHPQWPHAPSLLPHADALYDSSRIAHVARWFLPLPAPAATLRYLERVTEAVLAQLAADDAPAQWRYFVELSLYHQDMHNEAFTYTWQTLGHAWQGGEQAGGRSSLPGADSGTGDADDIVIGGGVLNMGARPEDGFLFDNEKWAHEVRVAPFAISRTAVSNGDFLRFVEDGGYLDRRWWDPAAWRWRSARGLHQPPYWRRRDGQWEARRFAHWLPLQPGLPVMHVSAWEAEAYCRWAGRRLPTEAEWEFAAATAPGGGAPRRYPWGDEAPDSQRANLAGPGPVAADAQPAGDSGWGCRQMLGNVWEWTASVFAPYPGFAPDPYVDYSQPWFGTHRVLRGGSFATAPRLARNGFRNFYTPDRYDVFAGFRTCAR